jgi:hypothetical protein
MMQVVEGSFKPFPQGLDTWKHRKGDKYQVVGVTDQPEPEKAEKFPRTVFYKGPDGRMWSRTLESWYQSFEFVSRATPAHFQLEDVPGYPWLPCPICNGTEGCDHPVPERMRAAAERKDDPAWKKSDDRIKRLMEQVGMVNNHSLYQAFKQHETEVMLAMGYDAWGKVEEPNPTTSPANEIQVALQSLTDALKADREYTWRWQATLSMTILESLGCTPEHANKAAADLMLRLFSIDMRNDREWQSAEPSTDLFVTRAQLEKIRASICGLAHTKTYGDKDRGYNKAIGHVSEMLETFLIVRESKPEETKSEQDKLPELSKAHQDFLDLVKANPGYKFNSGEAYDADGNALWTLLEERGLIRSVGSYKWVMAALSDEEVWAAQVSRIQHEWNPPINFVELDEEAIAAFFTRLNETRQQYFPVGKTLAGYLVFAYQDYYPNGGMCDFIGCARNGTAEEISALLRAPCASGGSPLYDVFSLYDSNTGKSYGCRIDTVSEDGLLMLKPKSTRSNLSEPVDIDPLPQELIEEFKKLPNVVVEAL